MRFALYLLLLLSAGVASAQDAALYEGEAPVADQSPGQREAALPRALAQVLVKVTGDAGAGAAPVFAGALTGASGMMQQYRYRQDVVTSSGVPELKLTLIARFNRAAVDGLVMRAGRTVWPTPRPQPLLWLAIDDGRGARLVGQAQAAAVASLTRRATQRGYSLVFPKADLQDQTLGGPQAVWREDVAAIHGAAARYGQSTVLLGRMQRGDGGWQTHWALLEGGAVLHRWSATEADATVALAAGADGAATALARDYSRRVLSGPAGDYDVVVAGLLSSDDYARVMKYLHGLPLVRSVQIAEAGEDRLTLRVGLRAGLTGLMRLVEGGGVLRPPSDATETPPVFWLER